MRAWCEGHPVVFKIYPAGTSTKAPALRYPDQDPSERLAALPKAPVGESNPRRQGDRTKDPTQKRRSVATTKMTVTRGARIVRTAGLALLVVVCCLAAHPVESRSDVALGRNLLHDKKDQECHKYKKDCDDYRPVWEQKKKECDDYEPIWEQKKRDYDQCQGEYNMKLQALEVAKKALQEVISLPFGIIGGIGGPQKSYDECEKEYRQRKHDCDDYDNNTYEPRKKEFEDCDKEKKRRKHDFNDCDKQYKQKEQRYNECERKNTKPHK